MDEDSHEGWKEKKDAIAVIGPLDPSGLPPAGGILIRENRVDGAQRGILLKGALVDVRVVGNIVSGCRQAAIQLEDPPPASGRILIAGNTACGSQAGFRVWDYEPYLRPEAGQVAVRNNLFFGNEAGDMLLCLSAYSSEAKPVPGDGEALIGLWRFDHNRRDLSGDKTGFLLPLAPGDGKLEAGDLVSPVSRDPSSPNFARPASGSALATEGAGKEDPSLPTYIGAVPPEGAEPWDWEAGR